MAKTRSGKRAPEKRPSPFEWRSDAEKMQSADLLYGPAYSAYRVIEAVDGKGYLRATDASAMLKLLRDQAGEAQSGNLSAAEAMLMNQATALQNIFVHLVESGMGQTLRANIEMFMKLALRAQNQCRATLETLATIKNPPNVAFVKQANIANGPQQINNGAEAPPARKNKIEQTQLLEEAIPNERLDVGTTEKASGNDSAMEPMGAINRSANRGRETSKRKAWI